MKALSRREFLKGSLAGASLVLGVSALESRVRRVFAAGTAPSGFSPNAWLVVAPDESVTVFVSKSEMGQGVATALPMIVAEELEADWSRIRVEFAPSEDRYDDPGTNRRVTGGSRSVRLLHDPLRQAGAAARQMLVAAAAQEWGVPPSECRASSGAVEHEKSTRRSSYGRLCQRASRQPVPENPILKDPSRLELIGTSVPRLDVADKSNGRTKFGIDTFVPGMLYGSVARPPAYGARVQSRDEAAALAVPGVRKIVPLGAGLAVLADTLQAAWKGRHALAVRWGPGSRADWSDAALDALLKASLQRGGMLARDDGDAEGALAAAAQTIEADYRLPFLSHAPLEPVNCTAHAREDVCEVWAPIQNQTAGVNAAAEASGLRAEQVRLHTTYLGGGFGRRLEADFVGEAVRLSKAAGRPVKLIWTREEDLQNDFYRPASLHRIRAALDTRDRILAWSHKTAAPAIHVPFPPQQVDHGAVEGIADTAYLIPNFKTEWVPVDSPVPTGWWRSVGHSANAFVVESFIDELAHAAGKDPLEFRLSHLPESSRQRRLLRFVAEKAGWGKPLAAGRGRGIAQHASFGSTAAHVAEVSVDRSDGSIAVHRIVCAVDCGSVINPDIVVAQLQGATIMGLSAALKEAVSFADGGVRSENFGDYNLLRITEAPEIEAYAAPGGGPLGGIGEVGLPPVAPAVANAAFAASGIRRRALPLTAST